MPEVLHKKEGEEGLLWDEIVIFKQESYCHLQCLLKLNLEQIEVLLSILANAPPQNRKFFFLLSRKLETQNCY